MNAPHISRTRLTYFAAEEFVCHVSKKTLDACLLPGDQVLSSFLIQFKAFPGHEG